jgi:hypothetical protein
MMRLSHAEQLQEGRGGDINPANAWADWREYREMTSD